RRWTAPAGPGPPAGPSRVASTWWRPPALSRARTGRWEANSRRRKRIATGWAWGWFRPRERGPAPSRASQRGAVMLAGPRGGGVWAARICGEGSGRPPVKRRRGVRETALPPLVFALGALLGAALVARPLDARGAGADEVGLGP